MKFLSGVDMKKNVFLAVFLGIGYSAIIFGVSDNRYGRNAIFAAAQSNDIKKLGHYAANFNEHRSLIVKDGMPVFDVFGMELLQIIALHGNSLESLEIGLAMYEACGLGVDALEKDGQASALHYAYRRKKGAREFRFQLISTLLDHGASPFIESASEANTYYAGMTQNAFDLTLNTKFLGNVGLLEPWLVNKKDLQALFEKNARYVLWHRLVSSYNLGDLSKEKIQDIMRAIFVADDACALVALLFWMRKPVLFANNLPRAPRCSILLDDVANLEQAKDMYRKAVVLPEAVRVLRRNLPGIQTNNLTVLLNARASGIKHFIPKKERSLVDKV